MAVWNVLVGRGWRDQAPDEIETLYREIEGPDKLGSIVVQAESRYFGPQGSSLVPIYTGANAIETAAGSFDAVARFLGWLQVETIDIVSIVFLNHNPSMALVGRPRGEGAKKPSIEDGIAFFCRSMAESVQGFPWSLCGWAAMTCTRVAMFEKPATPRIGTEGSQNA